MKDGATKSFEQCYNCQAAVDSRAQVIVSARVTQQANDKQQVEPLIEQMKKNLRDQKPRVVSADAGYYSEDNLKYLSAEQIECYVATGRQKHGMRASAQRKLLAIVEGLSLVPAADSRSDSIYAIIRA